MVQVSAIGLFDVIEDILTGHNVGNVCSWHRADICTSDDPD